MWTRGLLKVHAKENFKRNYWRTVLVSLVLIICVGGGAGLSFNFRGDSGKAAITAYSSGIDGAFKDLTAQQGSLLLLVGLVMLLIALIVAVISLAISIFLFNPLEVGCRRFFLDNHNEPAYLGSLGFAFEKNRYGNIVKTQFLKALFLVLWSLLFIIPGIVKSYSYRLVPYILADNPEINSNEAITLSRSLMNGNKWRAFVLDLSFLLWELLNVLTFGILGLFWVNPYIYSTEAELYLVLRYGIADPSFSGSDPSDPNGFETVEGEVIDERSADNTYDFKGE